MSFSPESFDRLFADKLAQAAPPAYEPAHWDQLEDQLQHLNHALQAAQPAAPAAAPIAAPIAAPLAGKFATFGITALLTGLTVVNGYFFYATSAVRSVPTPVAAAPVRQVPNMAPVTETAAETPAERAIATPVAAPEISAAAEPRSAAAQPQRLAVSAIAAPAPVITPTVIVKSASETFVAPLVIAAVPTVSPSTALPTSSLDSVAAADGLTTKTVMPATATDRLERAIPDIITPNGDGFNDRFELPLATGTCRLTVFDRTSRVVFSAERYNNAWDGGTLPAGEYRYLLEMTGPTPWRTTGGLTIVR